MTLCWLANAGLSTLKAYAFINCTWSILLPVSPSDHYNDSESQTVQSLVNSEPTNGRECYSKTKSFVKDSPPQWRNNDSRNDIFCVLHKGSGSNADSVQMRQKGRRGPKMVQKTTKASCFSHAALAIGCYWTMMIWILRTSTLRPCAVRAALSTVKIRTKRGIITLISVHDVKVGSVTGNVIGLSRGLFAVSFAPTLDGTITNVHMSAPLEFLTRRSNFPLLPSASPKSRMGVVSTSPWLMTEDSICLFSSVAPKSQVKSMTKLEGPQNLQTIASGPKASLAVDVTDSLQPSGTVTFLEWTIANIVVRICLAVPFPG
ncbi:hypothetical protein IW262DRAFT_1299605 [Armillaria fumosa]|nr:hypothetical protein IW262DRAFT_1299605 [Armillaria fumosa]